MPGDLAVIIPAFNEAERVGATVRAAAGLPGADLVVVVDDGSADDTAAVAARAGARVVRHARNRGKAAALETGAEAVRLLESAGANGAAASVRQSPTRPPRATCCSWTPTWARPRRRPGRWPSRSGAGRPT